MSFDQYVHQYDLDLQRGIRLSGEAREFFARGRLAAVQKHFRQAGVEPRRIVDFGCGDGTNIGIIHELWPDSDVVGLDTSRESLEVARQSLAGPRVRFLPPSEYAAHAEEPADWVFLNGVMHHVPIAERNVVLRSIRGFLRAGGFLTLFDNNPFNPGARLVMRRIPFDRGAVMVNPYRLMSQLAELEFAEISCRFLFIFPRFLSFLRFVEPRVGRLPLGSQYGIYARRRA